ncbi:MAG: hypothetical protein Q8933_09335 [Bacteroidota bacterium]|nr:hypothetical protein [Bacteroidota bacterium]
MKSIKLSELLKIVKPTYVYLKLTPHVSIRNNKSANIAKAIHHMYKAITKSIRKYEKGLIFETKFKCSYLIDIYKDKVYFYFIVPQQYENTAREKITTVWPSVTIEKVDSIAPFDEGAILYELVYTKEDAMSLDVDKSNNDPLNSILNVIHVMEQGDRVSVMYNFIPVPQLGWKAEYDKTIEKLKQGQPIDKQKMTVKYVSKFLLLSALEIVQMLVDTITEFLGSDKKGKDNQLSLLDLAITTINVDKDLSTPTKKKRDSIVLNTQALVISQSEDKSRKATNAAAVCQNYRTISRDNELTYRKVTTKRVIDINSYSLPAQINKMSLEECQNFIQLPGRELLQEYKVIENINTFETTVPIHLHKGTKLIGEVTCKGVVTKTYLTTDKDYKNLCVCIVGPTRSGKTSFLGNIARNSVDADECVIVLDYIENCGLSEDIKKCFTNDKILEIDISDYKNLQGLGYNEAFITSNEPFLLYESAKKQAAQVKYLINSINIDGSQFTPKMGRYLNSACLIVFINNGPLRDVFEVLQDHKLRHQYIDKVPENQFENIQEYICYLEELDEWSKVTKDNPVSEIIGTGLSSVVGIIDRYSALKDNAYMELMLKKECTNNINLLDEMQKNQLIVIKMPEAMFNTADERDAMVIYWLTKIWMCGQARAWRIPDRYARKTVNVITDEIAQLKGAEYFIGQKLDQTAKFGIKFIISTMYINQLRIRENLRTANTSYILISGSDKTNFTELKEEFTQYGFSLEDLLNLKRYSALCYIKYEEGYTAFIAQLPKPISI